MWVGFRLGEGLSDKHARGGSSDWVGLVDLRSRGIVLSAFVRTDAFWCESRARRGAPDRRKDGGGPLPRFGVAVGLAARSNK